MVLSYENYMNLSLHLNKANEVVPKDISKRIVANAIAPVITITSTPALDRHVMESYNLDSLYMLLRYFGGCVVDRDQVNEHHVKESLNFTESVPRDASNTVKDATVEREKNRQRSNSLFQRDFTQSQCIRFTKPIEDLINSRSSYDMLFDYHSLEVYLKKCLEYIDGQNIDASHHNLLKRSLYHKFFSSAISSTTYLSPYETFNHPTATLLALDISRGEDYDDAKELLMRFKNQSNTVKNFPIFMSTNEILPVFLLCYDAGDREQIERCNVVATKLKKQLFAEYLMLPLWNEFEYKSDTQVELHQPAMSSLDEMLYYLEYRPNDTLPLKLIKKVYDILEVLTKKLIIPFMQRKIKFWEETVLQPRKSLFHGNKLFKKFMGRSNASGSNSDNSLTKDEQGNEYFSSSSQEFLLRKLADWSMMISDFKTAYSTYETLTLDFEDHPKYLASCLEWCAICILMGAQSIVTVKMIRNEVSPLIERSLATYENCATIACQAEEEDQNPNINSSEPVRSYETRCMLLTSELFLSLNDTWMSTPYALANLETILSRCRLDACSQIMIWERLSDCYQLRTDPRIKHRVENSITVTDKDGNENQLQKDIVSKGLTRRRKAAFFKLLAANKWMEQKQWKQLSWCLDELKNNYDHLEFANRNELVYSKLKQELAINYTS